MFSFFSETDHLNYKVNFIGSIITQQYANQIHNLKENLKVNQLPMRVAYQQILKQLLLEMHHITISRNTCGPHLETKVVLGWALQNKIRSSVMSAQFRVSAWAPVIRYGLLAFLCCLVWCNVCVDQCNAC